MLVLTRKADEQIVITGNGGERITLTVVWISPDHVRLGFEADRSIKIHRAEVQTQIERTK